MISKALLSEVLKETIREVYKIGSNSNFKQNTLLFKLYGSGELCHINIYELAHKCKEWAYNQGYSYLGNNKLCNIHSKDGTIIALTNNNISKWYDINIDFIACQWILDKDSK